MKERCSCVSGFVKRGPDRTLRNVTVQQTKKRMTSYPECRQLFTYGAPKKGIRGQQHIAQPSAE